MRIGLVARWLSIESGGARQYTDHLIRELLRIDQDNEYVVLYNSPEFLGRFPTASEIAIPIASKLLWDYVGLPLCVRKERIDLLWTPSYVVPFPVACHAVSTFLDMAYFVMPESYKRTDVLYMKCAIPGSVKRSSALLAISENTRRDIVRLFPDAKSKIFVTHLAAPPHYRPVTDQEALASTRAEFGLQQPFIFYAGSISPRKGIPFLLRAFANLKKKHGIPHRLVLTGGRRWRDAKIRASFRQLPQQQLVVLGHVPDAVLPSIYTLADLFVYPSLYEGFGLPVLEAMACGCPVVCSNLSSLPEVAGDAALMVDPTDDHALADAMHVALTDPQTRNSLITKGLERSALFSWEETARRTLRVFNSIATVA